MANVCSHECCFSFLNPQIVHSPDWLSDLEKVDGLSSHIFKTYIYTALDEKYRTL